MVYLAEKMEKWPEMSTLTLMPRPENSPNSKLSKYSQVTPHLKACDEYFQKINIIKPKIVCINKYLR